MKMVLRRRELAEALGLSLPTVDRMVRRGDLPRPIHLSVQAVGWRVADIEEWLDERPETEAREDWPPPGAGRRRAGGAA